MPVFPNDQQAVPAVPRGIFGMRESRDVGIGMVVLPGKNVMPTSERFELSHEFRIGCSIDRQAQFDPRCVTSSNPTP
jgi:hypothetical protein